MQSKNIRSRAAAHGKRVGVIILAAVVIASLSIGTTYAYLHTTTPAVENDLSMGTVAVDIYENGARVQGAQSAVLGENNKQIKLGNPEGSNNASEVVRVTFVPEVEALGENGSATGANAFTDQNWPASFSDFGTDSEGCSVATLGLVTLHFASGWQESWTYNDGTFYYNEALEPGSETPVLLTGVTWADGVDSSKYGSMKVNVIADALQADAKAQWEMS